MNIILLVTLIASSSLRLWAGCVLCEELETGTQQFGVWGGYTPGSGGFLSNVEERRLALLAVRYGVVFANKGSVAFQYTADFMPIVGVFQPERYRLGARTVTGYGFAPLGFHFTFRRVRSIQPFLETTGGMIRTREPIPINVPEATRWNFMFDFGGGVQLAAGQRKAVRFGYKFHHISNANRSSVNPGLDTHIMYAGFSIFR